MGMPVYENEETGEPKDEPGEELYDDVIPMGPSKGREASNRIVDLAPDLQLDIDDIAGKAIFICGIKRSGKTTVGVRIAEELRDISMLIPDLKGDWLSCIKTLPNAVILGQGQATEQNAKAHGYAICEEGLQIIIDITTYDDMNEVAKVITNMINGIFLWERKHPENRRLCAVFLDEAQSFLPQDVKDSIISDPAARDAMQNAYMRVLAFGGSLGLFPVILTQRIAQVSKKIMGQPELLFLMKQTLDIDLKRYQDFTSVSTEKVRALQQGHGIFVNYEGKSSLHKFHKRTSSDAMSSTPRYRPVSPSPKPYTFSQPELENMGSRESVKGRENTVKQPAKRGESGERLGESFTGSGETFTAAEKDAVFLAVLEIAQSGQKVTRSAIKEKLGWNNKQYDVLKAVCDAYNIAMT
jgi:hypothetical protein